MKERRLIVESWAEGVETIVTNDRYRAIDANYFRIENRFLGWNNIRQRQSPTAPETSGRRMSEYTPLFIDLNDTLNQQLRYPTLSPLPPMDRVSGYSIAEMQRSLEGVRNLDDLHRIILSDHENPTEENLSDLFDYAQEVLDNM
jgi:hypothetical protein